MHPDSASKRKQTKLISTKPGQRGAGETETETDEPPRHLPISRLPPSPRSPLIPPNILQARLTPLLFEFSRLLSIVPALFGVFYLCYHIYSPPDPTTVVDGSGRRPPERVDFGVAALWALLTGYQCLHLTTGLLARWRVYYPPLATLIRLISLQAICWPATHLTLSLLEHDKRPVIVWAVIGTTTCASRSVQIWVTSNLWWEGTGAKGGPGRSNNWQWLKGGQWGGRRWDWNDVVKKCMLPAGVVYCVMAWAEQLRREWSGC
ncbi:hypothetical protein BT96DRAFT_862355 [Gymnopus androsaceus JB14]|uniref:Uncharacterized protein n=1 Tax=Gymnopus androsaceus JB14 TaxID=1447944 RepID=A0A6A4HD20_9AGAR|nr:hypothetical protein BT96DRAFT_862355 [Gymnopus androsaceus JB14]